MQWASSTHAKLIQGNFGDFTKSRKDSDINFSGDINKMSTLFDVMSFKTLEYA